MPIVPLVHGRDPPPNADQLNRAPLHSSTYDLVGCSVRSTLETESLVLGSVLRGLIPSPPPPTSAAWLAQECGNLFCDVPGRLNRSRATEMDRSIDFMGGVFSRIAPRAQGLVLGGRSSPGGVGASQTPILAMQERYTKTLPP